MENDESMLIDGDINPENLQEYFSSESHDGGLLSQRLLHSQIFHTILPYSLHDLSGRIILLFISATAIHVKDLYDDHHLRTLTVKDDFDCHVRAACILKRPASEEQTLFADLARPDILVLTLKSRDLLFLEISLGPYGFSFASSKVPLPARLSPLEEPGCRLSADPSSRALAVAAAENAVVIYKLDSSFNPCTILARRCELVICAMGFLYPPEEDLDCVGLVTVGTRAGRPQLTVNYWRFSEELTPEGVVQCHHRLGHEHGMPILLIPLQHESAFVVVCERVMATYRFNYDGSIHQIYAEPVPFYKTAVHHTLDKMITVPRREPLWTAWARSSTEVQHNKDVIYLIREDGLLHRLRFGKSSGNWIIDATAVSGQVEICVDISLTAILPSKHGSERFLAVGAANAAIVEVRQTHEPILDSDVVMSARQITLTNASCLGAPITGMAVVNRNNVGQGFGAGLNSYKNHAAVSHVDNQSRLIVASSDLTIGSISELRYGLRMNLTLIEGLPDMSGIDAIWHLQFAASDSCLLCSSPWQSNLICTVQGHASAFDVGSEPTLIASSLSLDSCHTKIVILRVSTTSIELLEARVDDRRQVALHVIASWPSPRTMTAAFLPETGLLLLGIQTLQGHILQGCNISRGDEGYQLLKLEHTICLDKEPTAMTIFRPHSFKLDSMEMNIDSTLHEAWLSAAVGLASGEIILLRLRQGYGFEQIGAIELVDNDRRIPCETLMNMLVPLDAQSKLLRSILLLCGLRDGSVRAIHVYEDPVTEAVKTSEILRCSFGTVPAHVKPDHCHRHVALVLCGSTICRLDFSISPPVITRILFDLGKDDLLAPDTIDEQITAFSHVKADNFICVVNGRGFSGILAEIAGLVPVTQHLPASPKRLIFSDYLSTLIVSTNLLHIHWPSRKRFPLSSIYLLDLQAKSNDSNRHQDEPMYICEPGEKINDLVEWFCKRGNRTYHFIIATIQVMHDNNPPSGQLKYFKVQRNRSGRRSLSVAHDSREADPVYSVAQYNHDSLVYGSGRDLKLRKFNVEEGRFDKAISIRLGSPVVSISVKEPLIYISTAEDGFLVVKYDYHECGSLSRVLSEDRARLGISHLVLRGHGSVLVSDQSGQIAHIQWSRGMEFPSTLPAVKQALLPCSIMKLVKANLRPQWKHCAIGVVEGDILGLSSDGSLFSFSLLTKPAWMLLGFVQLLCVDDDAICPYKGQQQTRQENANNPSDAPSYHVNGDILCRLAQRHNAARKLDEMLDGETVASSEYNFAKRMTPKRRRAICENLLGLILDRPARDKNQGSSGAGSDLRRTGNLAEDILMLMRVILGAPF